MLEKLKARIAERKNQKLGSVCQELNDLKKDLINEMNKQLDDIEREKSKTKAEFGIDDKEFEKELKAFAQLQQDPADKARIDQLKELEMQRLKQKQRFERESESIIDEMGYDDNLNIKQAIEDFDAQREEFKQRINATSDPQLKSKLMAELAEKEQFWAEELE